MFLLQSPYLGAKFLALLHNVSVTTHLNSEEYKRYFSKANTTDRNPCVLYPQVGKSSQGFSSGREKLCHYSKGSFLMLEIVTAEINPCCSIP